MSRAFVKEPDGQQVADDVPERVQSDLPNYITRGGLDRLHAKVAELTAELNSAKGRGTIEAQDAIHRCERELRYYKERLRRAIPVDVPAETPERVQFGVTVELRGDDETYVFTLVGEDETDLDVGRISWASPFAKRLIGVGVGDVVLWPRGDEAIEVEVIALRIDDGDACTGIDEH